MSCQVRQVKPQVQGHGLARFQVKEANTILAPLFFLLTTVTAKDVYFLSSLIFAWLGFNFQTLIHRFIDDSLNHYVFCLLG